MTMEDFSTEVEAAGFSGRRNVTDHRFRISVLELQQLINVIKSWLLPWLSRRYLE